MSDPLLALQEGALQPCRNSKLHQRCLPDEHLRHQHWKHCILLLVISRHTSNHDSLTIEARFCCWPSTSPVLRVPKTNISLPCQAQDTSSCQLEVNLPNATDGYSGPCAASLCQNALDARCQESSSACDCNQTQVQMASESNNLQELRPRSSLSTRQAHCCTRETQQY